MRLVLITFLVIFTFLGSAQDRPPPTSQWVVEDSGLDRYAIWTLGYNCKNQVRVDSIVNWIGPDPDASEYCEPRPVRSMLAARHAVLTIIDTQVFNLQGLLDSTGDDRIQLELKALINQREQFVNPDSYFVNAGDLCYQPFYPDIEISPRLMSVRTSAGVWGFANCVLIGDTGEPAPEQSTPLNYSVKVNWVAPTVYTSGKPLPEVSEFRVIFGQSINNLDQFETVPGNVTSHVVKNLPLGEWFFALIVVDLNGVQSAMTTPIGVELKGKPLAPVNLSVTPNVREKQRHAEPNQQGDRNQ